MASDDETSTDRIYYAELLAAKVVEGIDGWPGTSDAERRAMLELVAARLTAQANVTEATHASE